MRVSPLPVSVPDAASVMQTPLLLCAYWGSTDGLLWVYSHFATYSAAAFLITACIEVPFFWQAERNRSYSSRLMVAEIVV